MLINGYADWGIEEDLHEYLQANRYDFMDYRSCIFNSYKFYMLCQ